MDENKEKFSIIYDQYIEKIYRFVYLKVNSQHVAEDISSKVFLKGWESYKKDPKSIKNINAFLYRIASNMIVDHYREKDRTKVVSDQDAFKVADATIDIHEKAILNADIEMIRSALGKLKKDYQDVIIWHYLEDMPIEQISHMLGKPAGTIRVMVHRGLKYLQEELRGNA